MTRSQSSRINGAKSKGPVTIEGKAASSQNSRRHGLTGAFSVLDNESQEEFDKFEQSFIDHYNPSNPVEQDLVRSLAVARWRLRRIAAIETALFENELDNRVFGLDPAHRLAYVFNTLSERGALHLLLRYENSLNRTCDRLLRQLEQSRKLRNEPEPRHTTCTWVDPPPTPQSLIPTPRRKMKPCPDRSSSSTSTERSSAEPDRITGRRSNGRSGK